MFIQHDTNIFDQKYLFVLSITHLRQNCHRPDYKLYRFHVFYTQMGKCRYMDDPQRDPLWS